MLFVGQHTHVYIYLIDKVTDESDDVYPDIAHRLTCQSESESPIGVYRLSRTDDAIDGSVGAMYKVRMRLWIEKQLAKTEIRRLL